MGAAQRFLVGAYDVPTRYREVVLTVSKIELWEISMLLGNTAQFLHAAVGQILVKFSGMNRADHRAYENPGCIRRL